ncbi:MAG: Crp/Fnr family transcriptional regulator [Burkholderiales bacterium]
MVYPRADIEIRQQLETTIFGRLGSKLLDEVVACAKVERYEVPSLLNAAGEPLEWLRLVVRGHLEIVARQASGKEVVISDHGAGAWATWLPCLIPSAPDQDYCCTADSVFIALPAKDVRHICERHPKLYPLILAEIGQRQRLLMEWAGQSVLVGPEQRMAKLIHILARAQNLTSSPCTLSVTQNRLAGLARCTRQSANVILGALEKRGLIGIAYGKCDIPDLSKLATFAEDEATEKL